MKRLLGEDDMPNQRTQWNEATRVQMPALVHLTSIEYSYFGRITEDMAGAVFDPDTNILINEFKKQFVKLNPDHAGEAERLQLEPLLWGSQQNEKIILYIKEKKRCKQMISLFRN